MSVEKFRKLINAFIVLSCRILSMQNICMDLNSKFWKPQNFSWKLNKNQLDGEQYIRVWYNYTRLSISYIICLKHWKRKKTEENKHKKKLRTTDSQKQSIAEPQKRQKPQHSTDLCLPIKRLLQAHIGLFNFQANSTLVISLGLSLWWLQLQQNTGKTIV